MKRFSLRRRHFLAWLPAASLASCASPPQRDFRLAPVPGTALPGLSARIGVRGISIPADLDEDEILQPSPAYRLARFANDVWAEPLGAMLQTVMVQNLTQRLPDAAVIATGGAVGAPVAETVEINVLDFGPAPSGSVTLLAQIAIRTGDPPRYVTRNIALSAATPTPDAAGIAAAMSTLWGETADQIVGCVSRA